MPSKPMLSLLALSAALLASGPADAAKEGTLYYVNDFDGPDACGGSDLSWGDDTVGHLNDKLDDWSFDTSYYHGNLWLDFRDVADVDEDANGEDEVANRGIDSADIGMMYSHGSKLCSGGNYYSSVLLGDDSSTCRLRYGSSYAGNDAWWGDTDLNAMIVDTCYSAQLCAWNNDAYYNVDGNFAALLGFHGISSDGRSHTNNFEDFVDSSRYNGLGDNWVDDLTRRPIGSNNDECAVAIIYADNLSDANFIYDYMGFDDWKSPGSHTVSYYYYINGCNPNGGNQL
ncbi:hypothetical protein G6O69_33440 [Pseudenhygromyxa sp. WMMC2535]|uniref:hypothetical protein n=1 Tax=Pseudenhygromyxa sp. WMMC2535 TaxID=2712867 RepID=UPI001556CFC2|nr:hypothetical protein [Pseudenhygromyxa sp. WMMC2535]NVB42774.1 hypothetical protein [Pseudenhygromyxa sp. WMMC2535]